MSNSSSSILRAAEIELEEKVVSIRRVAKVTKGGRTFSFSALVVVGNKDGIVGYGTGKSREVTGAIQKGIDDAKKNLQRVHIIRNTIPHEQLGKFGAAKVLLSRLLVVRGLSREVPCAPSLRLQVSRMFC